MSEQFVFHATKREKVGKGASRAARREKLIPASLYGDNKKPVSILLNPKELHSQTIRRSLYSNIYEIEVDSKKEEALVREVQFHPVTGLALHVDFLRIGKNTVIRIDIPVVFLNQDKCPGLKFGGNLNIVTHSIEVACNPKKAPAKIEIDLGEAKVGTVIKIEDIKLPTGSKTYYPKGFAIVSITSSDSE